MTQELIVSKPKSTMLIDYMINNRTDSGLVKQVECEDGFKISVQASQYHYCSPRIDTIEYTHVECGFPNAIPELIMDYVEDENDPTGTVYGYVPVELVEELINLHGGIVAPKLSDTKQLSVDKKLLTQD